ncbi:MAG: hypothetical protein JW956_01405 [Calditrichaceae bacterium]|nr:hypothetical protein [Calditrichaceae bacterium]HES60144.1 hypothetical protein [Caldithrix sp.]
MKKILIVLILILAEFSSLFAQDNDLKKIYTDITTEINSALLTQKSSIEVSGFVLYNYDKTKFDDGNTREHHLVQVEPVISYFVINDLSFGLNLSYQYEKSENETGNNPAAIEQTFIGPIGKYYFGEGEFRPFVFADYLFLTGDNFDGGELGFGAGIMYHITGTTGLNFQIKYGRIWSDKDHIDSQNALFFGIGFSNFIF